MITENEKEYSFSQKFSIGQKVHYTPDPQNGIVKGFSENGVFVVFYCNGQWDRFMEYTGAHTNPRHLTDGWIEENQNPQP
jgi:hypothetical protein